MKLTVVRDDLEERKEKELEFEGSVTVREVLEDQGIPRQEVLVSRNDTILSDNHELEDGDELEIFDVIAGG